MLRILVTTIVLACLIVETSAAARGDQDTDAHGVPGGYRTSWIGNSLSGADSTNKVSNGFGYWVQDSISSMAVSPDGTVFAGTNYDEAGRTIGLYKNGIANRVIVRAENSPTKTWGWNTANTAVTVDGSNFYLASIGKALLHFTWTPGNINSASYVGEVALPEQALSLSCLQGKIALTYPNQIEVRSENDLLPISIIPIGGVSDAILSPDSTLWAIINHQVDHLDARGKLLAVLPGIGSASAIAWDNQGRLIVCDNGPAEQILFFNVAGSGKLVSKLGTYGGLYSGVAGAVAPNKLFALKGAGTDRLGNVYVCMSYGPGTAFVRAFSPKGTQIWNLFGTAFVDTFGFDPSSDGTVVYGRTTKWTLNLNSEASGSEASLNAITIDPFKYPHDPRLKGSYSVSPRTVSGNHLLYAMSPTGNGFLIFGQSPGSNILHLVGQTPSGGWAWSVTPSGDIWHGDAPNRTIALYRLQRFANGVPVYDWSNPQTWPWPDDFANITRAIYDNHTDSLYVFGYLQGQPKDSWGVIGWTARRYDGWLSGKHTVIWTNTSLPSSPNALGYGKPLTAKDVALAGDYIFVDQVRAPGQQASPLDVLAASNGQYVGSFIPGPEVGRVGGWQDMVGCVNAIRRADGEYLILIEEDWRAKNLLYRWHP